MRLLPAGQVCFLLRVVCGVDTLSWEPLGINGEESVKLSFKLLKLHESSTSVGTPIFQRSPTMFSFFVMLAVFLKGFHKHVSFRQPAQVIDFIIAKSFTLCVQALDTLCNKLALKL